MQSTRKAWISVLEASQKLRCDEDAVRELAKRAVVRQLTDGDVIYVRSEDIDEVLSIQGGIKMSPEDAQRRIILLERQVSRLQGALDLMLQVNQMSATQLEPMDDDRLLMLFINICEELKTTEWPIERLLSCCEVFVRISDDEMERLNELANTPTSWRPFYELCLKQLRYVTTHPEFTIDINLQRCRDLLWRGRNNLRSIAVISIEINAAQDTSQNMLARLASADVDEFDDLIKQFKAQGRGGHKGML